MADTPVAPRVSPGKGKTAGDERTFIEFFAGIGLVHMGLSKSGWRCVYANDFDPDKHEIYRAKFPDAEDYFHLEDVWNT
jgi:DNA (cytosine-5)-methyltransferase 1